MFLSVSSTDSHPHNRYFHQFRTRLQKKQKTPMQWTYAYMFWVVRLFIREPIYQRDWEKLECKVTTQINVTVTLPPLLYTVYNIHSTQFLLSVEIIYMLKCFVVTGNYTTWTSKYFYNAVCKLNFTSGCFSKDLILIFCFANFFQGCLASVHN